MTKLLSGTLSVLSLSLSLLQSKALEACDLEPVSHLESGALFLGGSHLADRSERGYVPTHPPHSGWAMPKALIINEAC